tara:strand:+ start:417 stop:1316 length:900 start_codon:yes stop_codon:yes gene_type:complete
MISFNTLISRFIPFLPKVLAYQFAKRYVAGTSKESAFKVIQNLNNSGYLVTLDILGEHTEDSRMANSITEQYIDLYHEINNRKLNCNISLKPSHIGADINKDIFNTNLNKIITISDQFSNFVRVDMESSKYTDYTIQLFEQNRLKTDNIGTVFQAYLYRTYNDIVKLDKKNLNFRLCKGIYKENKDISIHNPTEINDNYLKILRYAFENNIYVGIATHDTLLLSLIYKLIEELQPLKDTFEFQVLYGVPMKGWNEKHINNGYKIRVYVPFGDDWYKYSIRRLKENPDIAGYVLKNLFSK